MEQYFDWKGFFFTLKVFVFFVTLGASTYASSSYWNVDAVGTVVSAIAHKSGTTGSVSDSQARSAATTTPARLIDTLSIADVIPPQGPFIAADLTNMRLFLYQDGALIDAYTIIKKGRPGTAWETPSGFYTIQTKEENHFSSIGKVYMPYSMQFYGNYFIHGETYYPDGTPTSSAFSGGCIRLSTIDAQKVFAFAQRGTKVFVYEEPHNAPAPLSLDPSSTTPNIAADAYLVADLDTGSVYAEKGAKESLPIASVTKLMTALVANETISFDKKITVTQGDLTNPPNDQDPATKTFVIGDVLYPLLMQSSNGIAESLADYYGAPSFVQWMNTTAQALNMHTTTFADASGTSPENTSTPEDLFRFASYLSRKKSFVLNITHTTSKIITADDGSSYTIININEPVDTDPFVGGKVGNTETRDAILSVISFKAGETDRRIALIVLGSDDRINDTKRLAEWITGASQTTAAQDNVACATCTMTIPKYRVIKL